MVDNSEDGLHYLHEIREAGIPATWVSPLPSFWDTIELCYVRILERADAIGATYVCSIEADVICPPATIDVLCAMVDKTGLVSHRVPWKGQEGNESGCWSLGCALVTTKRLRQTLETIHTPLENALFSTPGVELDGLLKIHHLYNPEEPAWTGGGSGK
jgi:hypothetical protein